MVNGSQLIGEIISTSAAIVDWCIASTIGLPPRTRSNIRCSGMAGRRRRRVENINLPKKTTIRAFHYSLYRDVESFLELGWMVLIPNGTSHHHYYGIEVGWICDCEIVTPRAKKVRPLSAELKGLTPGPPDRGAFTGG